MYQRVMRSPFNRSENRQVMKCSEPIRASSKLAFSRVQGPYPLDDVSVYTINVDGSGLTRLTSDAPSSREFVTDWQPLPGPTGPKTKADCKNGGYKDFGFKNQGECIKAVKKAS